MVTILGAWGQQEALGGMSKMLMVCSKQLCLFLVPEAGIEPAQAFWARGILSPLRLPISPLRHRDGFYHNVKHLQQLFLPRHLAVLLP